LPRISLMGSRGPVFGVADEVLASALMTERPGTCGAAAIKERDLRGNCIDLEKRLVAAPQRAH
jgi:hypothetical protein